MFASDGSYRQGDNAQHAQNYMNNLPPLRSLDLQAPAQFSGHQMHTEAFSQSTTHPYSDVRYNVPDYHIRNGYVPSATYDHRAGQHAAVAQQPVQLQYTIQTEPERRTRDSSNVLNNLDPALNSDSLPAPPVETPTSETSEPSRLRKAAPKEKSRVDVLDDGSARPRTFVACKGCRSRKIKCDGARPACNNCTKRAKPDQQCEYDPAPRRRGPDRQKGGRVRIRKTKEATLREQAAAVNNSQAPTTPS